MKVSAGLLLFRRRPEGLEVFLVHPGGPFWAGKDEGAWSIPKGEYESHEDPFETAKREFQEETGSVAVGQFIPLQDRRQPSGKVISAWAFEGDCDAEATTSNTFSIEWPPRSGQIQQFQEADRAAWFTPKVAKEKILKGQRTFIDEIEQLLG